MTHPITTEWLKSVGCSFEGYWAYDVYGRVCVAQRSFDKNNEWTRWKNHLGGIPKFTARVKATTQERPAQSLLTPSDEQAITSA